ncbi:MAG: crotonase/enoyl-CoA hydratase family protein [Pseudomonadales bacterium]|nr:crotonase/enoyl-CoA hydratase family protein [Pseudomonadales bacterium]MDG1662824.1 crotonase/enoyl-CoA hydratase family protein [Pseudomonadales bacterium]
MQLINTAFSTLNCKISDFILTLTLNRPNHMNAFTVEMAKELISVFDQASVDDNIRAIVVTGAGKAFCAGMDLSSENNVFGLNENLRPTLDDMENRLDAPEIAEGVRDTGGQVTLAIYRCNKPVIAAINGAAVGIGATMTCAMDIRLASEHARIGFVFNKIGITPEACSTWFLPRIVGISRALEWCYTGDILKPEEALEANYIKAIVPADQLLEEAYKIAQKIARHSPVAIALTRQMMYRNSAQPHPLEAHKVDSLAVFYQSLSDGKEGVQSFLEKRAPVFTSKSSTDMPDFFPWQS